MYVCMSHTNPYMYVYILPRLFEMYLSSLLFLMVSRLASMLACARKEFGSG